MKCNINQAFYWILCYYYHRNGVVMKISKYINSILSNIPDKPGVYLMKDSLGNIIYVGKAISLKKRVRQYFGNNAKEPKVLAMVANVDDIEYILTNNEMEALILENNLIKKNKPFYNILLRDDKSFPYIKVTDEEYPKIVKTRNKFDKEGIFFGPYTDVFLMNNYLRDINEFFKIRDCSRNIEKSIEKGEKPCLNYYINICSAPCSSKISQEDYLRDVSYAVDFLKGNHDKVKEIYLQKMNEASKELRFEDASVYRDRLKDLEAMNKKQNVSVKSYQHRQDFISFASSENKILFTVLIYEKGNMVAKENYDFDLQIDSIPSVFTSFLMQYYTDNPDIPKEIYVDCEDLNFKALEEVLLKENEKRIFVSFPKIGKKKDIISLAKNNSIEQLKLLDLKNEKRNNYLNEAQKELEKLTGISPIRTIESFDISNISGTDSVGAKVVFKNGLKSPSDYRRYKVNQDQKPNDYASLAEIINRRLKKGEFPDIILLDGGKGHVSTIKKVLAEEQISLPVFGIYKDDNHQTRGLADDKQNYEIGKTTPLFRFLSEIQNEVHRFTITYHRKTREKSMIKSELDYIKGIGEKRKIMLLKTYGGIEGIKKAGLEELAHLDGMNKRAAQAIVDYFENKEQKNG